MLAECGSSASSSAEDDNKTLTIKLKEGIYRSDGEAFNADDIVFSYTHSQDKPRLTPTVIGTMMALKVKLKA